MVDAVTLGHMRLIERAGGRPEQIVFNGNSKTEAELRFALDSRIAVINVDSLAEAADCRVGTACHGRPPSAGLPTSCLR